MTQKMKTGGEPMLTADERALLALFAAAPASAYPLVETAAGWTWEYLSVRGRSPKPTREEAERGFAALLASLRASERAEAEHAYATEADGSGQPVPLPEPKTEDARLLSAAIAATGLSVRRFAKEKLVREPRTVWRWLAGENDLPAAVRARCTEILAEELEVSPGEK